MQAIMEQLYAGHPLNLADSQALFDAMVSGALHANQIAAALAAIRVRGAELDEIAGAALALRARTRDFPRPDYLFTDIVGTGGDGANTINISTASAFVAAACGLKVAKHGNRSVSSKTGSSDLLEALNIPLTLTPEASRQALDEIGICFLHAPYYHPGLSHVMPVRQQLKTRTLFNILGPLINPARPPLALIGVYHADLVYPVAQTLVKLGYIRAAVVHGDGLDEVALHSNTLVAELNRGKIECYVLTADDFGCRPSSIAALQGGTPQENAHYFTQLLQGKGELAHQQAVAANVALLLKIHGHENLGDNMHLALDILQSGQAWHRVQQLQSGRSS